jgi:hypothetical protein
LVCWGSLHPAARVHTYGVWDAMVEELLNALPACRNCGCVRADGSFA